MTFAHRAVAASQQLDGAPSAEPALSLSKGSGDLRPIPASQAFVFSAILGLAGQAAHLEAVRQRRVNCGASDAATTQGETASAAGG